MSDGKTSGWWVLGGIGALGAKALLIISKLGVGAKVATVSGSAALVTHGDDVFRMMTRMGSSSDELAGLSRGALVSQSDDGGVLVRVNRTAPDTELQTAKAAVLDKDTLFAPSPGSLTAETTSSASIVDDVASSGGSGLSLDAVRFGLDASRAAYQVERHMGDDDEGYLSFTSTDAMQTALQTEQVSADCIATIWVNSVMTIADKVQASCDHLAYSAAVAEDLNSAIYTPKLDEDGLFVDYILTALPIHLEWTPPAHKAEAIPEE